MAQRKKLNKVLDEDLNIKSKRMTLDTLLVESGISEISSEEVEEEIIEPEEVKETVKEEVKETPPEPKTEEVKITLPEIPTEAPILPGPPEVHELAIKLAPVQNLEIVEDAPKEDKEKIALDNNFFYSTDWVERYDFAGQNLGVIRHNLKADPEELVIKTSLRITNQSGAIVDEGLLLDQIHLLEDKQYGIGFIPIDKDRIKVLTAKDGVIWSSSTGEGLDYRVIDSLDTALGKVEYKISVHKMISNMSQLLEDLMDQLAKKKQ